MKSLSLFAFLAFFVAAGVWAFGSSERRSVVQPEESYTNDDKTPVYLLLKLEPGETYKNDSGHDVLVVEQADVVSYQISARVRQHEQAISKKYDEIESLEHNILTNKLDAELELNQREKELIEQSKNGSNRD